MTSVADRARTQTRDAVRPVVRWGLGHLVPRTVMWSAARKGDLQGKLIGASRGGDPFPIFEQMRAAGPLYRGRFAFVATSVPAVREVLGSNDFRAGFDSSQLSGVVGRAFGWAAQTGFVGPLEPPSLLVTEPPDHTRYRKLVTRVFSVRAVEKLRAPDRGDRDRAAGRARRAFLDRAHRGLLHAAAGHGDRRDPRGAGERAASASWPSAGRRRPASIWVCPGRSSVASRPRSRTSTPGWAGISSGCGPNRATTC